MKYAAIIAVLLLGAAPAVAQQAVAITGAPAVTDAPGKGIQPHINSAALPTLYDLDAQPFEQISPLIASISAVRSPPWSNGL